MSDTPKKELTDKEKADMAFNALAIKTMETSAKLDRVQKQLAQQKKRAAKKASRSARRKKRKSAQASTRLSGAANLSQTKWGSFGQKPSGFKTK
tara:strand:+ start:141 stop:422 length:282 start_codon:yes stop_codon:yes gene_type:complete